MKKPLLLVTAACLILSLPSCMTTYDAQGRPVQSIDPGLAVVGIIGAGLIGAALADSDDDHDKPRRKKKKRYSHHSRHHHSRHYDRRIACY